MNMTSPPTTRHANYFAGLRAQLPILLGVFPFGMIYGIACNEAGMPLFVSIGMSMFVFAGSSQLIAAQLIGAGTPGIVIVLTTFLVNVRHMLYSASVAPYTRHLSRTWKALLAFLLTDEAYAVVISNYQQQDGDTIRTHAHWYYLGSALTMWMTWQISTIAGLVLGESVPKEWGLDFALALTFIALLIPTITDAPTLLAALVAGIAVILGRGLPYNLGLVFAMLLGIGTGIALEQWRLGQKQAVVSQEAGGAHE